MLDELNLSDEVFVRDGYIRIYQDVRGKYGSEGVYLMTPPPVGPYNASGADDTTDAYDTINWLVKNVPESNGRVGMIGSSYEGFTVVMALLHPHPALKAAIPESPMVDGWMGDDWFHYGAFRQPNLDYFQAGHRIMVQVQSTFPLYDRNPQKYVPNIFDAKPADYIKATQRIYHSGSTASYINLPIVPQQPAVPNATTAGAQ